MAAISKVLHIYPLRISILSKEGISSLSLSEVLSSGISSYPALTFNNPNDLANTINNVYIEEVPSSTGGIDSINILDTLNAPTTLALTFGEFISIDNISFA